MDHQHAHSHHSQQQKRQPHYQSSSRQQPAGSSYQQQRREFLWRERVKLEMQVQALLAQAACLQREEQVLAQRKAGMQQRKPVLTAQILLSGVAGMRHLPSERLFQYERERLAQEEVRLHQAMMHCQSDLTALHAQIEVLQIELSFLS